MNYRAATESMAVALAGCFLITWVNEAGTLKTWADLVSFYHVTKFVSTFVLLTGMNQYLANKTYKGDSTKVIEQRITSDISELKNRPPDLKDFPKDCPLILPPKE